LPSIVALPSSPQQIFLTVVLNRLPLPYRGGPRRGRRIPLRRTDRDSVICMPFLFSSIFSQIDNSRVATSLPTLSLSSVSSLSFSPCPSSLSPEKRPEEEEEGEEDEVEDEVEEVEEEIEGGKEGR
jgi:hypothetical protein